MMSKTMLDWRVYFYANHRDVFLLLALIFPIDVIDTLLKGLAQMLDAALAPSAGAAKKTLR